MLNPKKCAFGVKVGNFFRFMLIERGIKANPTKCQIIINVKSQTNVREVQVLNDILATLN